MLVLVRCFFYTLHASFSEVFQSLTHLVRLVIGVSLIHLMLVLVRCFSYTPHVSFSEVFHASFSEVFLLHTSC